ncbi:MAG: GNAT family N-acetyltransferase, partial [Bdellovibrionales bacterium]|nr:GNAT family N-acetyltransferase [Bdellovibrionales bacterium]
EPYDRGFHFLIGDTGSLGRASTDHVIRSITHFLFLQDSRTERVVGEPRSDNKRVLKYVGSIPGWKFVKEFDFPHKRAALVMAERKPFFLGDLL